MTLLTDLYLTHTQSHTKNNVGGEYYEVPSIYTFFLSFFLSPIARDINRAPSGRLDPSKGLVEPAWILENHKN